MTIIKIILLTEKYFSKHPMHSAWEKEYLILILFPYATWNSEIKEKNKQTSVINGAF